MHTIRLDYLPNVKVRWDDENGPHPRILEICEANRATQTAFIAEMARFEADFRRIELRTDDPLQPHWQQSWFMPLDGMSSYTMVASRQPRRLFEIGSGNSTKFFARAKREHNPGMELLSIDPRPRAEIDILCDRILRQPLEDVDPATFDALEPGDVLFFDGSHRAFQNSDVTVLFLDILPRLKPGVIVGLHDIFWPYDYPTPWLDRYYNEQYMLATYMLAHGTTFPLIAGAHFIFRHMMPEMRAAFSPGFETLFPERIAQRFDARINGFAFWFTHRPVG